MGVRSRASFIVHGGKKLPRRSSQNAQALVEMALILPILLVLIVGALEFGRLWSTKIILTNAAREGAYYMSMHSTNGTTCDSTCVANTKNAVIGDALDAGTTLSPGDISVSLLSDGTFSGAYKAVVTAQTTVGDLLILGLLGNADHTITIHSSVEMMIQ